MTHASIQLRLPPESARRFRLAKALTLVAAAAALFLAGPAEAQTARKLKIGYVLPEESQFGAGVAVFAEEVRKRIGERIAIEQYPNGALGGDLEMLKAVELGTLDMVAMAASPLSNIVPELGVFNIPFIFRSTAHAYAVLDGPIGKAYIDKFKGTGFVALGWAENGLRHITNSKRAIRNPEDLKGLKLRLPQSEVMLIGFRALGADVSTLAFPQLYGALQSGQFDGQENPIGTIIAVKFAQVQKYLTLTGHIYDPALIVISQDAFDTLSEGDQKALRDAAKIGGAASRKFSQDAQAKGVLALARAGMKITAKIDAKSFADAMAGALPEYGKRFGAEAIERIKQAGSGS
jgi:tripartite ATP-independent transporter DctP family solute receptor